MKRIISLLLVISMLLSFVACGGKEKTYTVTFDTNGGSAVSAQSVKAGECAKEPTAPTKGELYFAGWYADSALTVPYDFGTPVTGDITLYAKWTRYEGTVSASTSSVDTFFITDLIIDKSDKKASATVSAPADCTFLVRFVDEEIYFSEEYPANKSYISENSLYASCAVKADTDMGTVFAEIAGSLPAYYVAEAMLIDEDGNALCDPASFIEHTQRYEAYDNTTIHDFADTDTVLQFSDSETSNFGVLSDDVIALNVDSITVVAENSSYQITGMTGSVKSGDKVFITDKKGTALFLGVKSASSNGAVTQIVALPQSNLSLTDFYKFVKLNQDIVTDVQNTDSALENANGHMLRLKAKKGDHGTSASKVIKLDLDPIRFDSENFTITGDISGSICASIKLDYAIHLLGESYFRFDFSYTIKGDAELDIADKPGMAVEWTEIDLTLGEVKLPLGVPGTNAVAQINARIAFEADGGVNVFGSFETNQGFRYNTKDGYQTIDKKKASWTMSCEGYGQIEFGPNPVVSIEALGGAVSCELDSFIGVRGEATISEPVHGGDSYHACSLCAEGVLFGVVSTDAELEYRLTKKVSGKPIDQNLVYVENRLCDFYVSLENDTDSIFGGKVTFGKGECPNWVTSTVATEPAIPTEPPATEPPTELPELYSEGLEFTLNADGNSYTISGIGTCEDTDIVIPSKYNGLPVTSIGESAFQDCGSLTSITIPGSVTSIGNGAFSRCTSLKSITIPDSVTDIGAYAFLVCISLTSITIPGSVTSIGGYAFLNCRDLVSVTIPDSVTRIMWGTFSGCRSLTSITIPDSVTSIGQVAFSYCSSLISITLPDSVTSIEQYAFTDCSSLTSIYFNGTAAQWRAVGKGDAWNRAVGEYTVYCTDGQVAKDGTVTYK